MKTLPFLLATLLATLLVPLPAQATNLSDYDRLLSRYVFTSPDGVARVSYGTWKSDAEDVRALNDVVGWMERQQPSRMSRDARFTYWVNLYNAVTLQIVLENYPVRSIRDIRSRTLDPRGLIGPWRTERVTVEGRRLTLDTIEHGILRSEYRDPRIHYAVNCASIGCPNLMARAWRAETLQADLEAAAIAYVNSPRGVSVDIRGALTVSRIYQWFAQDFGGEAGVLAHLRRYASPGLRTQLQGATRVSGYMYDWSLNGRA